MFGVLYNIFLGLYFCVTLPVYLFNLKKYRSTIMERLFFKTKGLYRPKGKKVVWIHAVSLGETKVASAIARKIKDENEDCFLIVSTTTKTGYKEGKKSIGFANAHFFLPLDFSWIMKKIMRFYKPENLILVETDFWYNFLTQAKKNGALISLINGKLSDTSFRRYKKFVFFTKRLFPLFDIFCVQDKSFMKKFSSLGVLKGKIHVTGNLKLGIKGKILPIDEIEKWKKVFKIDPSQKIVTVASTHKNEEERILKSLENSEYRIFLAPRHPERFNQVKNILINMKLPFGTYSHLDRINGKEKVILIDTMGFLNTCYQLSDLAIVGGSFIKKVGGHNILEPISVYVPVFFGPYMQEQKQLKDIAIKAECAKQVTIEDMRKEVSEYFEREMSSRKENCRKLTVSLSGHLEKTFQIINKQSKKTSKHTCS